LSDIETKAGGKLHISWKPNQLHIKRYKNPHIESLDRLEKVGSYGSQIYQIVY